MWIQKTKDEIELLDSAIKMQKFSHLPSWKLLLCYQRGVTNHSHILEIAKWSARNNRLHDVKLPLMLNDSKIRDGIMDTPWTLCGNKKKITAEPRSELFTVGDLSL